MSRAAQSVRDSCLESRSSPAIKAKCQTNQDSHVSFIFGGEVRDHTAWKVLEVFCESTNLSLIARSTGKWIDLEPVDLMYGSDLLSFSA